MGQSHHRTHGELELETNGDVHHDDAQRHQHAEAALFRQLPTHFGADVVRSQQGYLTCRFHA